MCHAMHSLLHWDKTGKLVMQNSELSVDRVIKRHHLLNSHSGHYKKNLDLFENSNIPDGSDIQQVKNPVCEWKCICPLL